MWETLQHVFRWYILLCKILWCRSPNQNNVAEKWCHSQYRHFLPSLFLYCATRFLMQCCNQELRTVRYRFRTVHLCTVQGPVIGSSGSVSFQALWWYGGGRNRLHFSPGVRNVCLQSLLLSECALLNLWAFFLRLQYSYNTAVLVQYCDKIKKEI